MDLETLSLFSLIAVLIYGLVKSADLIEDGFVLLAKSLKMNEFFIGFVILSAVSNLPEFSIVLSSNNLVPELSVGNLVGGSVIILTLVIGLSVIKFGGIEFKGRFREKEVVEGLSVMSLSILALYDGNLEVYESLGLMGAYIIYVYLIHNRYKNKRNTKATKSVVDSKKLMQMFFKAVVGSILILVCSSLLVDVVIEIGGRIQLNEALVGLFILAIGTNIPEITILLRAKKVKQKNLALGNFIGSATINVFILGLLGILSQGVDLNASGHFIVLVPVLVIFAMSLIAFLVFSWTGHKLTKTEGAMLIGFYIALLIAELTALLFRF